MLGPGISYVLPENTDSARQWEFARCKKFATPRPESKAVRAAVPAVFVSFATDWRDIVLTTGQQRWLRTLNIAHHPIMAGTCRSMAPRFEAAEAAARTRTDPNYPARRKAGHNHSAAE